MIIATTMKIMHILQNNISHWLPAAILVTASSTPPLVASPFPDSLELLTLKGSEGFAINGIDEGDLCGFSVSGAGDVNGDGIDDLIISANAADPNGDGSGECYVVFGFESPFPTSIELALLNGANGFVINGMATGDRFGRSVSGAGDVNGDGIDDLIIGAYSADRNGHDSVGESYVVFGSTGPFSASFEIDALNGSNGFVITGIEAGDQFGVSVSTAGDVNNDGIEDIIIGANGADPNGSDSGASYVIFGSIAPFPASLDLAALNGANGFVINGVFGGSINGDQSGISVSSAGDINGDDIGDLIIGACYANANGQVHAGKSYVVFGSTSLFSSSLELSSLNGANGFVINGVGEGEHSGCSVSRAGDVNGDGIDDLIIGASDADATGTNNNSGKSYVVFGSIWIGTGGTLDLSTLSGANGFVCNGIDASDFSGRSVADCGDVNDDGFDDVIIGAHSADANGVSNSGESYVVFGSTTPFQASFELAALNGTNGFVINGFGWNQRSGISVSSAGDINGDGIGDLIIGASGTSFNSLGNVGKSYVVYGRSNCPIISADLNSDDAVDTADLGVLLGFYGMTNPILPEADINSDGVVDTADLGILIGAFGTTCP